MVRPIDLAICVLALLFAPASRASAQVQIEALYSEPANLFSLMDNVSAWQEGLTDSAYREEWSRRFGWSRADQQWADSYADYRRRTYADSLESRIPSKSPDGIFATLSSERSDPLATHFFQPRSVAAVFSTLGEMASPTDAKMLLGFYRHFASKWRAILAESPRLTAQAKTLDTQLNTPGATAFVTRLSRFYRVRVDGDFRVFFVWYPPGKASNGEVVAGRNFLIHLPPANTDSDWDTVAMHELVHYVSARQSSEQKQMLTKRFLALCPAADRRQALPFLEEPLAVAWGQAAFAKFGRGMPLDWEKKWYATPEIDILGHLLWPTVESLYNTQATIADGRLIDVAAKRCAELTAAATSLSSTPPPP